METKIRANIQVREETLFDDQVSPGAGIKESKIAFHSGTGHDHDGVGSKAVSYLNLTDKPIGADTSFAFYLSMM